MIRIVGSKLDKETAERKEKSDPESQNWYKSLVLHLPSMTIRPQVVRSSKLSAPGDRLDLAKHMMQNGENSDTRR